MFIITIKSLKMFAHTFLLSDDDDLKMKSLGKKNQTKMFLGFILNSPSFPYRPANQI